MLLGSKEMVASEYPFLQTVWLVKIEAGIFSGEGWFMIYECLQRILRASYVYIQEERWLLFSSIMKCIEAHNEFRWSRSICTASWSDQSMKYLTRLRARITH